MIELNEIRILDDGCRVEYNYSVKSDAKKYFNNTMFFVKYPIDVSSVPNEILVIPFLANMMPIAWFAGFNVKIDVVDKAFYNSLKKIKNQFSIYHNQINQKSSELFYREIIQNQKANKDNLGKAMLFSGGVDAYATYFRNFSDDLDLITIHGADIDLNDISQWNDLRNYIDSENLLLKNNKFYIKSNIRNIYTFEVDKLLPDLGWWGKIQHGLSLTSLVAPISFNNYKIIYIASSYTRRSDYEFIIWGSMPEIDNLIQWSNTKIIHDGEKLTRQDKIKTIYTSVSKLEQNLSLRVCYSDNKASLNCSICEKCLRTIFGLMILGANPNDFGFKVDISIYDKILAQRSKGFKSKGGQLFWREMFEFAQINRSFYYFEKPDYEEKKYSEILEILKTLCYSNLLKMSRLQIIKLEIINKYPNLFKQYLKLRRKIK